MAYNVSKQWEEKIYGGDKRYVPYLLINNIYVPANQISSISFIEETIDKEKEYLYLGTFIANQIDIKFKSLDNLDIVSNLPVYLEVGLNTDFKEIEATYIETLDDGLKVFRIVNNDDLEYIKENYYINIKINDVEYERLEILSLKENDITIDLYQISEISTSDNIKIYPFEYIPKGSYLIDDLGENYYQTCQISCLDYSIKMKTAVDYSSAFDENGEITLEDLLKWLCTYYGIEIGTYPDVNRNKKISVYDSTLSGKTYASYIAEMMSGNVKFNRENKLCIFPLKSTPVKTINALKTKSFEKAEKYQISRVYYTDGTRVFENGESTYNTLQIRQENMFVVDAESVENIYNSVKDLEIYSLDNENFADPSLDCWDIIVFQTDEQEDGTYLEYPTYNNCTLTYSLSFMTKISTSIPTKAQEESTNVVATDEKTKIRRIQSTINQLEGTYEVLAEEIDDTSSKVTSLELDVNGLATKVSNVIVINGTDEGKLRLSIKDSAEAILHKFTIHGKYEVPIIDEDLVISNQLIIGDNKMRLIHDNEVLQEYELPMIILNRIDDVYDEFVCLEGECSIIRRIGVNADGSLYKLDEEVVEELSESLEINLPEGNSIIEMDNASNMTCEYLLKNEYTDRFATKVELNSAITQTKDDITLSVSETLDDYYTSEEIDGQLKNYPTTTQMNTKISQSITDNNPTILLEASKTVDKKLEDYSTTSEMNSAIKISADSINSEVSKKVGKEEIISQINQSAEAITILANKLGLTANDVLDIIANNAINLTSKNITIESDNVNIDSNGNMTMETAQIKNGYLYIKPKEENNYGGIFITQSEVGEEVQEPYSALDIFGISIARTDSNYYFTTNGLRMNDTYSSMFINTHNAINTEVFIDDGQKITIFNTGETGPSMTPDGIWSQAYNNISLESQKKNISLDDGCLEQVLNTDVVDFNWKFEDDTDKKHIGMIIPDEGGDYKYAEKALTHDGDAVDLYSMIMMSWKAIQELYDIIETQNKKIEELEEKLNGTAKSN
jgi:hypothetical protein